jgi:hypothetical protein
MLFDHRHSSRPFNPETIAAVSKNQRALLCSSGFDLKAKPNNVVGILVLNNGGH